MPATRRNKKRGVRSRKIRGGGPINGQTTGRQGPFPPRILVPPPNKPVPPPNKPGSGRFDEVSAQIKGERELAAKEKANKNARYAEERAIYKGKIYTIDDKRKQDNINQQKMKNKTRTNTDRRRRDYIKEVNFKKSIVGNLNRNIQTLKQRKNVLSPKSTTFFRMPWGSSKTLQKEINEIDRQILEKEKEKENEELQIAQKEHYINNEGPKQPVIGFNEAERKAYMEWVKRPTRPKNGNNQRSYIYNSYYKKRQNYRDKILQGLKNRKIEQTRTNIKPLSNIPPNPPPTKNPPVSHPESNEESNANLGVTVGAHHSEENIPGNESIVMNWPKEQKSPKTFLQRIRLRGGKTRKQRRA
jgi:hypothetical protein